MSERRALLELRALDAHYGDLQALFGVNMRVSEGEVVAGIGATGAGKSTLLKCIAGAIKSRSNSIMLYGTPIGGEPTHEVVARGIAMVPEGRRLFPSLTVHDNIAVALETRMTVKSPLFGALWLPPGPHTALGSASSGCGCRTNPPAEANSASR